MISSVFSPETPSRRVVEFSYWGLTLIYLRMWLTITSLWSTTCFFEGRLLFASCNWFNAFSFLLSSSATLDGCNEFPLCYKAKPPLTIYFLTVDVTGTGVARRLLPSVCSEWPRFFIFIFPYSVDFALIAPSWLASVFTATRTAVCSSRQEEGAPVEWRDADFTLLAVDY